MSHKQQTDVNKLQDIALIWFEICCKTFLLHFVSVISTERAKAGVDAWKCGIFSVWTSLKSDRIWIRTNLTDLSWVNCKIQIWSRSHVAISKNFHKSTLN